MEWKEGTRVWENLGGVHLLEIDTGSNPGNVTSKAGIQTEILKMNQFHSAIKRIQ